MQACLPPTPLVLTLEAKIACSSFPGCPLLPAPSSRGTDCKLAKTPPAILEVTVSMVPAEELPTAYILDSPNSQVLQRHQTSPTNPPVFERQLAAASVVRCIFIRVSMGHSYLAWAFCMRSAAKGESCFCVSFFSWLGWRVMVHTKNGH